ncbi:bifunctional diaminohydroxyphosphoribosylaminopyrimidine deaminase/5-amino-6-(5-phosphoribosylamino)uracil reductase RibD [Marinilactibacillus kalidii]|uniref:bifunctional diaminohydroxyphosphoribosylaminopyrimidine deaminase/5-amino-6-(5-phosphoribosylamino)uracil reductase RibD n=1 Tax=Marinilactibacillus kalidii TaxID=2820274 RepID=UPI001ABE56CE|nr:bifunctional diaminohydroxyphosphoribosylaminopyrimidine deaminase/5-amino-6-(5-phosphoribosylamino)uracil reductase RibD [Marinilactibacillus kalidii]
MNSYYMEIALNLAEKGSGRTAPNPLVGAVIVKNERVIGQGYHERYGGAHAEVNAINGATESVEGATLYVTLEPCVHFGKTPPCADLIIKSKIKKVVVAAKDPNPLVAGKGIQHMRKAGIEVIEDVLREKSEKLNEIFNKFITTNLPFVIMKYAMSLDGKIATELGESKWISSETSRNHAHTIRGRVSAILVGIGTVLKDDPLLTCRVTGLPNPVRIIIDKQLDIPESATILQTLDQAATIIVTSTSACSKKITWLEEMGIKVLTMETIEGTFDFQTLMASLGEWGIDSVLIEGGAATHGAAIKAGVVDKLIAYIAPKIIGGSTALSPIGGEGFQYIDEALKLKRYTFNQLGEDILVEGYFTEEECSCLRELSKK